jgi:hypothetical protein
MSPVFGIAKFYGKQSTIEDVVNQAAKSSQFISDCAIVDYQTADEACSAPELLWHGFGIPAKQLFCYPDIGQAELNPTFWSSVKSTIDSNNLILLYLDRAEASETKKNGGLHFLFCFVSFCFEFEL